MNPDSLPAMERLRLSIRGVVQGVGFRPFVHRLASELGLAGWVRNSCLGVTVEVEGPRETLELFLSRLVRERPAHSSIQSLETTWLDPLGYPGFTIRPSDQDGPVRALVLPDIATCEACLRELFDPADRRFAYPFINCTHCGPRYSIITALPYDRPHTTMAGFMMCPACREEYHDPTNRRFHAQPNACPQCGPHLELWTPEGHRLASGRPSQGPVDSTAPARATLRLVRRVADALRAGAIVAVKGLGGFHLMVLARLEDAVQRLRQRKHREAKPFALMFPSVEQVRRVCHVEPAELRLLTGPEAPIVLLRRLRHADPGAPQIAASVAPGNPSLGVMLPYTPLHHLLLRELAEPVVATSGNLSDEPICTDEQEALERLGGIADLFLVHNRPIARHVDDSVARVVEGRELVLRRARGYAPLPVPLPVRAAPGKPAAPETPPAILAVGAHLKNTVGLALGPEAFLSQHIGDLETEAAEEAFRGVVRDLPRLYNAAPEVVLCDLHPNYVSSRHARRMARPSGSAHTDAAGPPPPVCRAVQHHLAHVLAVLVENELEPPVLGVAWDGTGLGWDGTVWGGEFFRVEHGQAMRVASFRRFRLPGGDAAVREPRRTALGLLYELYREDPGVEPLVRDCCKRWFTAEQTALLWRMVEAGIHAPWCCSVGRLFDAVACLAGLRSRSQFEAQAAMELEFCVDAEAAWAPYPLPLREPRGPGEPWLLDWGPMIRSILAEVAEGASPSKMATRFHQALVAGIVAVARAGSCKAVLLSGGCFQNQWLLAWSIRQLRGSGFRPYWPQRVPPNDGSIALGQLAAHRLGLDQSCP